MASGHQVALTRAQRMPAPSTHISKSARQLVPAFLQKLYEMVNDPNNAELIRWSDAGDSFFVLDHERFAHEVLGRWFKHRNFSSFVRQLNMYGFHKIPHLQQGVLKSDTETEFWNFAHANFHRGQPDLLCLIQRKKQPQAGEEGSIDLRDTTAGVALLGAPTPGASPSSNPPPPNATLSSGQILDVNSIVNGITAIKRHQTTISAELNELKRSNQLLWQESLAARAKHQKQQDIINRIVKFLAGVFGNGNSTAGTGGGSPGSPGTPGGPRGDVGAGEGLGMAPGARRKMRLMIEDAKRDGPRKSMVEELTEVPMDIDDSTYDDPDYPTIETPISVTSPSAPSPAPSTTASERAANNDTSSYYSDQPSVSAMPTTSSNHEIGGTTSTATSEMPSFPAKQPETVQQPSQTQQGKQIYRAVTPVTHSPPSFEFDPRIHGLMNQLTPSQIQQLLTILAPQTFSDPNQSVPSMSGTVNPGATNMSGPLTPYLQPSSFDFSINPTSQVNPQPSFGTTPIPPEGLIPFDQYLPDSPKETMAGNLSSQQPQQQQSEPRLERQWQAAEDIDKDVNALNSSINSLIQTFGLDPSLLGENAGPTDGGTGHEMDDDLHATGGDGSAAIDFDFDTFFNNLSSGSATSGLAGDQPTSNGMDYNDLVSTAFLDEVQTPSSETTASPMQPLRQVSPEINLDFGANNGSSTGTYSGNTKNLNTNTNTNTNMPNVAGRKRKSDVDFQALADAMGGPISSGPSKTTTTGPAKSKRRKDK